MRLLLAGKTLKAADFIYREIGKAELHLLTNAKDRIVKEQTINLSNRARLNLFAHTRILFTFVKPSIEGLGATRPCGLDYLPGGGVSLLHVKHYKGIGEQCKRFFLRV